MCVCHLANCLCFYLVCVRCANKIKFHCQATQHNKGLSDIYNWQYVWLPYALYLHTLHTVFSCSAFGHCAQPKSSSLNIFNLILYCGRLNDLYEMPNTKGKHKASDSQSIAADTDTSIDTATADTDTDSYRYIC